MSAFGQFSFSVLKKPHSAYAYTLQILQNHENRAKNGPKKCEKNMLKMPAYTTHMCKQRADVYLVLYGKYPITI